MNAFYYAVRQITFYNEILADISSSPLRPIAFHLQNVPNLAPSGVSSGDGSVSLTYANGVLDPSLLAHEIGHEVHFHLLHLTVKEWYRRYASGDLSTRYEQGGVMEGTANILAAFANENHQIGYASYFDVATDVDRFQRFPDVVFTVQDVAQRKLGSGSFTSAYPKTARGLDELLTDPKYRQHLSRPDPYWASALINQPLWRAATTLGRRHVLQVYFRALADFPAFTGYSSLARRLVDVGDEALGPYLHLAYTRRGLL